VELLSWSRVCQIRNQSLEESHGLWMVFGLTFEADKVVDGPLSLMVAELHKDVFVPFLGEDTASLFDEVRLML